MWGPASSPPPLESGQVHVWRFRLDVDDSRLIACRALLTDGEHERAERFAFDEPCRRFIVARGTLRALLSAYVDIAATDLVFAYGDHGKPRLVSPITDIGFNLSHSGGRILLACARDRHVGVDVERTRRDVDWGAVSERFFEGREREALLGLPATARRAAFFRCWTRKEAFMKATGKGVAYGLSSLSVTLAPDQAADLVWLAEGDPQDWGLADADPDEEHAGAVCATGRDWRPVYLTGDSITE